MFFLGIFFYLIQTACAADSIKVIGDQVEVYRVPSTTSLVLEKLSKGSVVFFLGQSDKKFQKVMTEKSKKIGWILIEKLQSKRSPLKSVVAHRISKVTRKPAEQLSTRGSLSERFQIVGLGGMNFFNLAKMFSQFSSFLSAYSVGGEVSWFLFRHFGLTFHSEYLFGSALARDNLAQLMSLPVMGGFKWSFLEGKNFFLSWNVLGGLSLSSAVILVNRVKFFAYPLLVSTRVDFNYRISQKLFVLLQGGYLYQIPHPFNVNGLSSGAQSILNPQFSLDFSGFFCGMGVGASF